MANEETLVIEGEHGISPGFTWKAEYESLLETISETNMVDSEWDTLRDILKYKLIQNTLEFVREQAQAAAVPPPPNVPEAPFVPLSDSPDLMTTDGPLPADAPPPPSPSPPYLVSPLVSLDLQPSTPLGLVLAPFPPRPNLELHGAGMNGNGAVWDTSSGRALPAKLNADEAKDELGRIFAYLHDFDEAPPFTVQRLAELSVKPRGHYKSVGKYIRALECTLLVTSTHKDYTLDTYALDSQNGAQPGIGGPASVSSRASTPGPLDVARSPLFSPIPFLHRAAPNSNHRSLSRSPPPTSPRAPLPGDVPGGDANITGVPTLTPEDSIPALGLVDELDDPRPGHLSDHPTPLTSVTQIPDDPSASLESRFVSAGPSTAATTDPTPTEGLNAPEPGAGQTQPTAQEAEGYVRAKTVEPSPTRVLAEEARERDLATAAKAQEAEGTAEDASKQEGAPAEGTSEDAGEKKETEDRMSVDERDEDKENVPS